MVGRGNLMFSHRNNPYCELVVSDNAKILILKQSTTTVKASEAKYKLCLIMQRY